MELNDNYEMSFFKRPISNKAPQGWMTPFWVYQYMTGDKGRVPVTFLTLHTF